jgi:cytochrome c-type biogenesis protein CcsB
MSTRLLFCALIVSVLTGSICSAQSDLPAADSSSLDFKPWGLLAIQDGGRRKPLDTFARETLTRITGRSSYADERGKSWRADDFLLSALVQTHEWKNEPMVLVTFGKLADQLGLDKSKRRFSFAQLSALPELNRLAAAAHALQKAEKPLDRFQQEVMRVSERLTLFAHVMDGSAFLIVPSSQNATDVWVVPPAYGTYYTDTQFAPVETQLQTMATAYVQGDSFKFSRGANQLREKVRGLSPQIYPRESSLRLEYFYNHFEGFYRAAWCYGIALALIWAAYWTGAYMALRVFAALICVGGMIGQIISLGWHAGPIAWATQDLGVAIVLLAVSFFAQQRLGRKALKFSGIVIAAVALLFQASGIILRCMIAGRPPVTNMYESIIWVSFAVSFFGMIFFARYRTPVYLLAALPVTLVALLLVHQMPIAMPSSIDPLVPVLRDNFWLTIHVLTITLSYAAFALAMGFGHILLFRYARNPSSARADQPMHFWLYRVLQLGVILLAAGTILGGVWANYSWGRFWGWDPKETWALIALLCYILTLHGRLAGWWTQFGLVVASVVCFLAVLMAWYGVNFVLGKGLHSYGFGIGGETYVAIFVIADLLFVGFAIWRYRSSKTAIQRAIAERTVAV